MKSQFRHLPFFLILTSLACSGQEEKHHNTNLMAQEVPGIKYEILEFEKTYGMNDSLDDPKAMIRIQYPEILNAPAYKIKNELNDFIKSQIYSEMLTKVETTNPERFMQEFIDEYKLFEKDFPSSAGGWIEERVIDVLLCECDFFCFSFSEYSYTGGAHPNSTLLYFNYDVSNGSFIQLDDLLMEGYENKLNKVAESRFRYERQLPENETFSSAGYFIGDNKFSVNDNFLITKNGLKFFFNTYEVAPYSYGTTEIFIPFSEINNIIRKNSLLKKIR